MLTYITEFRYLPPPLYTEVQTHTQERIQSLPYTPLISEVIDKSVAPGGRSQVTFSYLLMSQL